MTGNSPNNSLLDILGRYKPIPWRGGYSLSRLFFNFYLLVMGSFVVIELSIAGRSRFQRSKPKNLTPASWPLIPITTFSTTG